MTTRRDRLIAAILLGLTAILIVLQGVWAGLFLASDPRSDSWIHVHDLGAWATLLCSVAAAAWVTLRLRSDRALWLGSVALVLAIAGEAHLGGQITDNGDDALTAVHVPLALVLMGLGVWLPTRAARLVRTDPTSAMLDS
ncbi:hypothetical protein [Branchiibius sp. NY16-3462-2]|uniref:hypothetical protein n=1 Tax=Branchiibius sp. NY16-3462-2 TaxID=1807500 RepID=UPI0007911869|nr:hypothetical protein [Branchiibius sp. NY16-3462-2]KYH43433.1 hypothetical protein AZH51_16915 [Branchiibius sp. NY16-3462-2]